MYYNELRHQVDYINLSKVTAILSEVSPYYPVFHL